MSDPERENPEPDEPDRDLLGEDNLMLGQILFLTTDGFAGGEEIGMFSGAGAAETVPPGLT